MSLPLSFALRYLRSKKSLSVINIISRVSSVAIGVAVAAMVILLSVYNGFDSKLHSIYNGVDPDLKIAPTTGKTFELDALNLEVVSQIAGVEAVSVVVEDNILVEYADHRQTAVVRGVDDNYTAVVPTDQMMWYGGWRLQNGARREAVVGRGVDEIFADGYSVKNTAMHTRLRLYAPRRENISTLLPFSALRSEQVFHAGTLTPDATDLSNHIFVALDVAQRLLGAEGRYSSVAVKVSPDANLAKVRRAVSEAVGDTFHVSTREEQNELAYKVMKYEKWSIFFILLLVTVIAAFSIVGSIVMLILDKRRDIGTLSAMGAGNGLIRKIFLYEGLSVGGLGLVGGMLFGLLICLVQWRFEIVTIPGTTFLFSAYPVAVKVGDLVGIALAVMAVNYIIANFTVAKMLPRNGRFYETRN